jgi:hypothetical protein
MQQADQNTINRALRLLASQRAASKRYYETNRDIINERSKTYWEQNREAINARRRERYEATHPKVIQQPPVDGLH